MPAYLPEFYTPEGLARSHESALRALRENGEAAVEAAQHGDHVAAVYRLALCHDSAGWAGACAMGTDAPGRAQRTAHDYTARVISILGLKNKSDDGFGGLGRCVPCPPRRRRR